MDPISNARLKKLASVGISAEGHRQAFLQTRNKNSEKDLSRRNPSTQPNSQKDTATMSDTTQTQTDKHSKHNDAARTPVTEGGLHNEGGLKGEELFSFHMARMAHQTDHMHQKMLDDARPVSQIRNGAVTFGIAFAASTAAAVFVGWLFSAKVAPVPTDIAAVPVVKK